MLGLMQEVAYNFFDRNTFEELENEAGKPLDENAFAC
jgi:hypothetical protein